MSEVQVKHLADFEWASAVRYMVWVSQAVDLKEVSSEKINSFPLAKLGVEKLIDRKRATKEVLEGNLAVLARFVGKYESSLERAELVLLRSMYGDIKRAFETVQDHIEQAQEIKKMMQASFEYVDLGGDEDDVPF